MASERVARVPSSITGIWGEAAVVLALREAGCEVEWEGGMTRGGDLLATTRGGRRLALQVKTSTANDGRIAWRKDGTDARVWGSEVAARGATALYVFVHFPTQAAATIDLPKRTLTITMPKDYLVAATTYSQFAQDVDAARARYGQQVRRRSGKGGKVGDLLTPEGLQYPVFAGDYPLFSVLLSNIG